MSDGWAKLTAPLPPEALKALPAAAVGGLDGMSDIHEWYIYERLRDSGLTWSETIVGAELVAHVDKTFYYVERVRLTIDGQDFDGIGGHDHEKLEWAVKGAHTSAFKDAAKWAGITMSVWKAGPAPGNGAAAASRTQATQTPATTTAQRQASTGIDYGKCPTHGVPLIHKSGVKNGKPWSLVGCTDRTNGQFCRFILPDTERARIEAAWQPASVAAPDDDIPPPSDEDRP